MNRPVQYVDLPLRFEREGGYLTTLRTLWLLRAITFYKLPYEDGKTKYRYVVTALDRLHNESKICKQER